ncbi:mutator type transposase [Tanacetum coccineum]
MEGRTRGQEAIRMKIIGVIPAIAETFPSVEHRCCLKHIYDNMKLSWRGKLYKELLWKCAMATTIQKFDKRMEEMKNHNIEAYEWLRKIPPQHSARSHFLEKAAAKLKVDWNGSDLYQVSCPWGDQFVVNMTERVCSCRKWELSGIPCTHAVAAIWDMASNGTDTRIPESYCNPCHWLSTWKKMYRFKINPVNGPQAWKKSDVSTTIIPPKPHLQIGRPPKKRKKSAAELADEIMKSNKMTRSGKSVTCSLWGVLMVHRPHIQHRLQLEEDARVKKVDMLVLVDKGMETYVLVVHRPHKQLRVHFEESNILVFFMPHQPR